MPAVSVLMVFHRDTPFLRPAIASVLGQTWRDLELVLVDNGTGLPVSALGEPGRDPRVRWVRLPANAGIAAGHNAGVAAAQGDFIGLLDYDDLMMPRRLERQVAALRADAHVGLIASLAEGIDENDRGLGREFALVNPDEQQRYSQFAAPFFTPASTGRREVFADIPYREAFLCAADFDFITRVAEEWRLAAVPEVLCRYRHHGGQTTVQQVGRIAAERCAVRLLTARRRAGRPEGSELIPGELAAAASPAVAARRCAMQCLAEGFTVLTAYHARRSFAEERTTASGWRAARLFGRALRRAAPAERRAVARMFLTGPVRALGVRPA
jgi:GT2 family glycosyltransferase